MLPICDLFTSIQGEGKFAGMPSIFIRVSGCNLRCVFKGSICDTPYSSFTPEKSSFTIEDVKNEIASHPKVNHIVITGGEPLLYKKELEEMLNQIWEDRFVITIETNGSLPMLNPIGKFRIALYSVSPKLHTSIPEVGQEVQTPKGLHKFTKEEVDRLESTRINVKNLAQIMMFANDYQLKFVYSGPECIKEIEDIYLKVRGSVEKDEKYHYLASYLRTNPPEKHTMLMPEGVNKEQLESKRLEMSEICIEKGWAYTDRLHILIWGDKRGF